MKFELLEVKEKDKEIIYNLMQLYTHELTVFEDETTNFQLLESGLYVVSEYVGMYWKTDKRRPYILKCNDELAGFALQRYNEENMNEIAEFFIVNKYKRCGAGSFMAKEIFELYRGKWEVRTLLKNERAQSFWRKVIKEYTNNNFEERLIRNNTRVAFYFEN